MGRYVLRRLLQFIPTVLGTMFLIHYMTSVAIQMTGNPVRALFGDRTPPPTLLVALTERLGLGDSCLHRRFDPCLGLFADRMRNIFFHWDFGVNFRRQEVTDIIARSIPWTIRITVIAIIIEIIIGIGLGLLAGLRGDSFWDLMVKVSTVLLISIPVFVVGVLVREGVGVGIGNWLRDQTWVPDVISHGVFSPGFKADDYPWASLFMPAFVLASLSLATTARLTRTSIMENIRADYVRTAKAKGLTTRRVIGIHTLRNSLIPVVTFLGVDVGALLGGALITETIFNIPGIGRAAGQAARSGEASVVLGIVILLALVFMTANLLVDILYAVLDPRIRYD